MGELLILDGWLIACCSGCDVCVLAYSKTSLSDYSASVSLSRYIISGTGSSSSIAAAVLIGMIVAG